MVSIFSLIIIGKTLVFVKIHRLYLYEAFECLLPLRMFFWGKWSDHLNATTFCIDGKISNVCIRTQEFISWPNNYIFLSNVFQNI